MEVYSNLRPMDISQPIALELPAAAWMSIFAWYHAIKGDCPELTWLSNKFIEATTKPAYFKEQVAAIHEGHTLQGQLRAMGAPEQVIAEITRQISGGNTAPWVADWDDREGQ